jgi:hypothetical protein
MMRSTKKLMLTTALLAALASGRPGAAPAQPRPGGSLCRVPEAVLFTCDVGAKTVSICGQEQGGAAYRFGRPGRVDIEVTDLHRAHAGWSGGETQVYADTPTHRYLIYNQMVRTTFGLDGLHDSKITSGLVVQREGRTVLSRECGLSEIFSPFAGRSDQQLIQKLVPEGNYMEH